MNEPPAPPFHHTLEELEFAYRRAKRPIERTRWQVIWLKRKSKTTTEISDVVGYRPDTICKLVARYFAYGEDALVDRRQFNRSELALNPQQQAQLLNALQTEREDSGL